MKNKRESREQKVKRYSKLSKKDLIVMLIDTQMVLDVVTSKTPKKTWNSYNITRK